MHAEFDLTQLPLSMRLRISEYFKNEQMAAIVMARIEQQRLAKFNHDHRPRAIEGLGGQTTAMTPFMWSALRRLHPIAPDESRDLHKWAAKKYPEFRVRHTGTKMQVGYFSTPEFKPKIFTKTYPETSNPNTP